MRNINLLVIHCSASDKNTDDSVDMIKYLHTANRKTLIIWGNYSTYGKGWADNGYHYVITKDGTIHIGRPIHKAGAHCKGLNKSSIGICLTGDKSFSQAQFKALRELCQELILEFGLSTMDVVGHNQLNKHKTCPNFDVQSVLQG